MSFRICRGGAQEHYGVEPDLTAFGKTIGGGLPLGAFGGREDVMSLFDGSRHAPVMRQSGTFSGNPLTMAAAISTLTQLTQEAYDHLNSLGELLRAGLKASFSRLGIQGQVTGIASLFGLHFTVEKVVDYRSAARTDKTVMQMLHLSLMNHGIFMTPRGLGCISLPMTKSDVQEFIDKFETIVQKILRLSGHTSRWSPESCG